MIIAYTRTESIFCFGKDRDKLKIVIKEVVAAIFLLSIASSIALLIQIKNEELLQSEFMQISKEELNEQSLEKSKKEILTLLTVITIGTIANLFFSKHEKKRPKLTLV